MSSSLSTEQIEGGWSSSDDQPLLDVRQLKVHLNTRSGLVRAVDGIDFQIRAGETLGIVGESGSGKSMTGLALMGLLPRAANGLTTGEVRFRGENLLTKSESEMRKIRGTEISMILQDPTASLNPVLSVGLQMREAQQGHRLFQRKSRELEEASEKLLRLVEVPSPKERLKNYPHELSGGMKQRIVGAMSVARHPALIIADEPTTALDVTIQAQYLRLLADLQRRFGMALIIITHDFGVVAQSCDRVAVMYAGRLVEQGSVFDIFDHPSHPYTRALLASVPTLRADPERLATIKGQPPEPTSVQPGCPFEPRCEYAMEVCSKQFPDTTVLSDGHTANCWLLSS